MENKPYQIPTSSLYQTWKMTFLSSSNWIIICLVSQFTFQAFIVEYLHVFIWSPFWRLIRITLLEPTPSSSSFFSPWNLTTNELTPYSGRDCQARMKFIFASNKLRSFTLAWDSRIFWRSWKKFKSFLNCNWLNLIPLILFFLQILEPRNPQPQFLLYLD